MNYRWKIQLKDSNQAIYFQCLQDLEFSPVEGDEISLVKDNACADVKIGHGGKPVLPERFYNLNNNTTGALVPQRFRLQFHQYVAEHYQP